MHHLSNHPIYGLSRFKMFFSSPIRDAPAFAVYFPVYEIFMDHFDPYRATQIIPFIGGGLAGMWTICIFNVTLLDDTASVQ